MSGHANFILLNGTWLGANDSSKALGFVVLSPVATLSWEIHTTAGLRQGQKKKKKPPSVLHALRAYVLSRSLAIKIASVN